MDYDQLLDREWEACDRAITYAGRGTSEQINLGAFTLKSLKVALWQELDELAWEYYKDCHTTADEVIDLAKHLKDAAIHYKRNPEDIPE